MTPEVIVAIVAAFFSGLATVLALLSYLNSRKASRVSTELLIQQLISDTRKDTNEFMYAISGENKDAIAKQLLASYIERELDTYDVACAAYIDKKIDRARFKKTYSTEIQNLFEKTDGVKKILERNGRYNAIKKVYNEWFNLEK